MNILKKHGIKLTTGTLLGVIAFGIIIVIVALILFGILGVGLAEVFTKAFDPSNFDPSDPSTYQFGPEKFFTLFGYALLLILPIYLLISFSASALIYGGLVGSVNDAVYRDQSSVGSFVTNGFEKFWKMFKVVALNFLVISIPLLVLEWIIRFVTTDAPALGILLLIAFYFLVMFPISIAIEHGYILSLQKNLRTWESVKVGLLTFTRAYGQTYITFLLVLVSSIAILIVFGIFLLLIFGVAGFDPNAFLFILAGLVILFMIPFLIVTAQTIITKRLKVTIAPRVFGDHSNNPKPTTTNQDSNNFNWE